MTNDEGKVNVTVATNLTAGEVVTATATSTSKNTSEFSETRLVE